MEGNNFDTLIRWSFNALLFVVGASVIFSLAFSFKHSEKSTVKNGFRKQAVTGFPEELTSEEKDYIVGSVVLNEILSYPDNVTVIVNGTVLNNISTDTGEDYITYAKKYGTAKLENQISMLSNYKRKLTLDGNGQVTGVEYTIAY